MTNITDENPEADRALTPASSKDLARNGDNLDAAVRFAQFMAKAKTVLPKHLHDAPGECLAIVMISRDWNMNPYMVGSKTSVINNRLMYEGQLVNGVINNSRALEERLRYTFKGEGKTRQCVATGRIRGEVEPRDVTVGTPGPGEATNSPLWKGSQEQVDQQLTYKAARVWCRRHLPEIMLGVYTPEDEWTPGPADSTKGAAQSRVGVLENQPTVAVPLTVPGSNQPEGQPVHTDEFTGQKIHCGKCGGAGIVEDETGKGPCPDCTGS